MDALDRLQRGGAALTGIALRYAERADQTQRRLGAFGSGLADTLQLMSGSLSAGLSLGQSIDTIVREGNEPSLAVCRRLGMESLGLTDRWYGVELHAFRLKSISRGRES